MMACLQKVVVVGCSIKITVKYDNNEYQRVSVANVRVREREREREREKHIYCKQNSKKAVTVMHTILFILAIRTGGHAIQQ